MKKIILFCTIAMCAGLYVTKHFASEKPSQQKGFFDKSLTEHAQNFKEWIRRMYQKAPTAGNVAMGAATGATLTGQANFYDSAWYATGGYMAYNGIKIAWQAILDGKLSSSIGASVLLTLGLGMSVFPGVEYTTSAMENQKEILEQTKSAILALGFTVVTAGLISKVYHNVMAPIDNNEISVNDSNSPSFAMYQELVSKGVTKDLIEAALRDKEAYPTPSTQINALLKRTDFLQGDDTDTLILEVCSDLIGDTKYSPESSTPEQKEIDKKIDELKETMTKNNIVEIASQINSLKQEQESLTTGTDLAAVRSLIKRLGNRLAIQMQNSAKKITRK